MFRLFRNPLWVCIVLCKSAVFGENLVENGNFATGDFTGWSISSGSNVTVEVGEGPGGSNAAQINTVFTDVTATLSQNISSLGINQPYDLTFSIRGLVSDPFVVSLGGVNLYTENSINLSSYNEVSLHSTSLSSSPDLQFSIAGTAANYNVLKLANIMLVASSSAALQSSGEQIVNLNDDVTLTSSVITTTIAGSVPPQKTPPPVKTPSQQAYEIYQETLALVDTVQTAVTDRNNIIGNSCSHAGNCNGTEVPDPLFLQKANIQKIIDNAEKVEILAKENPSDTYLQTLNQDMQQYSSWAKGLKSDLSDNKIAGDSDESTIDISAYGGSLQKKSANKPELKSIEPPIATFLVPSSIEILNHLMGMQLPKNSADFTSSMFGALQFRVDALGLHSTEILRHIDEFAKDLRIEIDQRSERIEDLYSTLDVAVVERAIEGLQVSLKDMDVSFMGSLELRRVRKQLKNDLAFFILSAKSLSKIELHLQKIVRYCEMFLQSNDIANIVGEGNLDNSALVEVDIDLLPHLIVEEKKKGRFKYSKPVHAAYKKILSATKTFQKSLEKVESLHEEVNELCEKIKEVLPNLHHIVDDEITNIMEPLYTTEGMLAANFETNVLCVGTDDVKREAMQEGQGSSFNKTVNVWGRVFGQYIHQNAKGSSPSSHVGTGGVLVGSDWKVKDCKIGFATAYSYSYLEMHKNNGHTEINLVNIGPYVSYGIQDWSFNFSVMGGYVNADNTRNILGTNTKARSKPHTWQMAPHVDIHYNNILDSQSFTISPYIMGDYAASWQSSFSEHGAQNANTAQDGSFSGFIRTEAGLEYSEVIQINYGLLTLKEKGAWVYQRSFSPINTITLVGTINAFAVPGSANVQNLGLIEFSMNFAPKNEKLPVVQIGYTGQFGSIFMSQVGSINISKAF